MEVVGKFLNACLV